ncbi:RluA family pseudouridine synthase [Novipirellula artificiosorum]|uniref:Ribosomal large subunit pseudouridine synthase C n=1 Tax=Novipirellula artificiosorum TaxID=2528016 RepID=A0A5C6DW81_9BACT|nr:RluA family pseudouridine synthase [Novipirellula artificiosorum]TWU39661.1 Ribosomal large subunit pseudouridine synthase C [Novipirellula artificiosorum]
MFDVLFEDNHLLVVDKPAGLATMGAEGEQTLHWLGCEYLRTRYNKPGRAFLGIVSRLDAMTSGVIVMAKTSKAASRLAPQFSGQGNNRASKIYLAMLEGALRDEAGERSDFVIKDDAARRMRVCGESTPNALLARLRFATLAKSQSETLVAVQLLSGRKHQIRVQFANLGHPVWADRKYGGRHSMDVGIGLHSLQLAINHPTLPERKLFKAPLPKSWHRFGKLVQPMNQIHHHANRLLSPP